VPMAARGPALSRRPVTPCQAADRKSPQRRVRTTGSIRSKLTFGSSRGVRSSALSTPTRSPLACERSWPNAARGRGAPPTFCGPAQTTVVVTAFRPTVPAGLKIPARSPAACVARRRSCRHWASRLRSVVKAGPEVGSSGLGRSKIPSAPSAAPSAPSAASASSGTIAAGLPQNKLRQHRL